MSKPALCFRNYIEYFDDSDKTAPTLSATSENANYPIENIANWRIDGESRWKATTKVLQEIDMDFGADAPDPDTLVIAGHNTFNEPVKHSLLHSDDDITYTTAIAYQQAPSNHPMMTTFAKDGGHQYWRVAIEATTGDLIEIAHIFLGVRLDFPVGLQPGIDYFSATPAFYNDSPLNGSPIGRAVSHLNKSIRLDWGTPGFTAESVLDFFPYSASPDYDDVFMRHLAAGNPFWFSPDNDNQPTHLYLCHADGFSTPFDGSLKRRTFSGTITGYSEIF